MQKYTTWNIYLSFFPVCKLDFIVPTFLGLILILSTVWELCLVGTMLGPYEHTCYMLKTHQKRRCTNSFPPTYLAFLFLLICKPSFGGMRACQQVNEVYRSTARMSDVVG